MKSHPLHTLIVEDSPGDAGLIVRRIEHAGFEVRSSRVDDPVGLKAALAGQSWDIVLCDYCLPGFSGSDALAIVRAHDRDIPFIFVSGTIGEEIAVEAMRAGAHDYVMKGNLARLVPAIERELREAAIRRQSHWAAQALRQNEQTYRTLVNNLPQRVVLKDRDAVYISCNRNFARSFGAEPEAVVGKTDFDFYPPEAARYFRADDENVMVSGIPREAEEFFDFDGKGQWVQLFKTPINDDAGRCVGLLGIFADITDRKEAEAHLRLQSSALEAAANAIAITGSTGIVQWINTAFTTLTGYTPGQIIGGSLEILRSGKLDPAVYTDLWDTINAGRVWHGELLSRRKDGALFTEETTITPIIDTRGQVTHFISVRQDITERKQLQAQFLRAQRMESIGTLAGGIAHDLNNGLAPILMAVEALKTQVTQPGGARLLDLVTASVGHCSALVRQVLTFARGAEGQSIIINPVHLVKEIQNIVSDTFPKNIQFISSWPRGAWTLTGDPTHLHQVLINLCVNARDAMPDGGILHLTLENIVLDPGQPALNPDSNPGPYVLIKVQDTGAGIPPDIRDRIFEPFFTTKEIGRCTGLGLSTSLGIIKSHHGIIRLHSEIGQGTTFSIYLPADPGSIPSTGASVQEPHLPRGHGELVLLVDDEERIRAVAQSTLEQFGYRVLLAAHGAEAVALYARHRDEIAIVLTDIAMPVMDGPAAILALRSLNPEIKVIASSGLAAGLSDIPVPDIKYFISKPYTAEAMLTVLAEALRE
jgi:PAS domain S-box-containing protein